MSDDLCTSRDANFVASATLDLLKRADRGTAFQLLHAQLERFRTIGAQEALEEARQVILGRPV